MLSRNQLRCDRGRVLVVPALATMGPMGRGEALRCSPRRSAVLAVLMVGGILVAGCSSVFGPKGTLGPGSIIRGRGLYSEVISRTSDEQTLRAIVQMRYGESIGLLTVANITASLKFSTSVGAQFGYGPSSNFERNLVPLSTGVAYEESPTISYTPVKGERYVRNLLSPIGLEILVLFGGIERGAEGIMKLLLKQVNGLRNPLHGEVDDRAPFDRAVHLLAQLRRAGLADLTASPDAAQAFALVIHGYAPEERQAVQELLRLFKISGSPERDGGDIVLPLRLAVGSGERSRLDVQTRSILDVLHIAAAGVRVPPEHIEVGVTNSALDDIHLPGGFLEIQRSSERPPRGRAMVAIRHHGWWFYIAAADGPSKFGFRLVDTLLTMVQEGRQPSAPVVTIPAR